MGSVICLNGDIHFLTWQQWIIVCLQASQVDNPAKYDTAQLVVHVRDANEHAPMFERGLYQESVPEFPRTRKGGRILQIQATDMDHVS